LKPGGMAIVAGIIAIATLVAIAVDDMNLGPKIRAPEFPRDVTWLNSGTLTIAGLKGKILLLDFWTYCCINCMHIIPDLKRLETKYKDELVVIGMHSAKFYNEKDTENIRQAILRYGIQHPVINDRNFEVWQEYEARAWPTVALIDPDGYLVGVTTGEGIYESLDRLIAGLVKDYDARGALNHQPLQIKPEIDNLTIDSQLAFPGKIVADEKSGRLFITDSNNNRILIVAANGEVIKVIGSGAIGFEDGDFSTARFFHPQGLCYDAGNDLVYVADTENHAIRRVNLKSERVETIAGTGQQARLYNEEGIGRQVALNSPWDLILIGDALYIAMAGSHQIWILDTKTLEARVFVGSGRENIIDGPRKVAALAQPSGITTDGQYLYWVDSEASGVRRFRLNGPDAVETIIGVGLFDFGDIDGRYPQARLQHPIGITWHNGFIYVADTYNHKIKRIDPQSKEAITVVGTGKHGHIDGPALSAELYEPNGLCFLGGKMYITNTNNHRIRVYDSTTNMVSTLKLGGLERPSVTAKDLFIGEIKRLPPVEISKSIKSLTLKIELPAGMKINPQAPFRLEVVSSNPAAIAIGKYDNSFYENTIIIPIFAKSREAVLNANLDIGYCGIRNESLCYFRQARLEIPARVTKNGQKTLVAEIKVTN